MEEFSKEKLIGLLKDQQNMDQNCLFIQIFPPEVIDEVWDQLDPFSDQFIQSPDTQIYEFYLLFLIAFGAEGSLASEVRNGRFHRPLTCWPEPATLHVTVQFHGMPAGVVSQLVEALSIERLVIESEYPLQTVFEMDFMMIRNRITSVTFFDMESQYQLTNTLYASEYLTELSFVRVEGAILPVSFDKMPGLKNLSFIQSNVIKLPVFSVNNRNLERLRVSQSLNMGETDVSGLPISLKELDLSMNKLTEIKGMTALINLKKLNLSNTLIKQLDFSTLPQGMMYLNLRSCKVQSLIGAEKTNLSELQILDLGINLLNQLPSEIGRFTALKELMVSDNQLECLLGELTSLVQLERLDLRNNSIRVLPPEFKNFQKLCYLDLEDNGLIQIFDLLDSSEWKNVRIRLSGNSLQSEKKKLVTLNNVFLDL